MLLTKKIVAFRNNILYISRVIHLYPVFYAFLFLIGKPFYKGDTSKTIRSRGEWYKRDSIRSDFFLLARASKRLRTEFVHN